MKIKRIEHIAVAVNQLSSMREILENKLGLTLEYEENLPQYNTRIAMYPVGDTYIEILESNKKGTEVSNWIDQHGESLFHICLEVDDIDAALVELRQKDVRLIDETPRIGHANSRISVRDPASTGNLLIDRVELAESAESSARTP